MKLRRNEVVYDYCTLACAFALNSYYTLRYSGAENIPKRGPALLLAKHQSLSDIILEGYFLRGHCKRYSTWIMKSGLPGLLHILGGVKVIRPEDIKKLKKKKRRKALEKARDLNPKSMAYVEWLYQQGEIIVVHPEGTRVPGEMGQVKKEVIDFTRGVQERHGIKIPAIPVGIEYKDLRMPGSRVYLRAGKPIDMDTPEIEEVIHEEIRRLSNL